MKMKAQGRWSGQTRKEFDKNYTRVEDIIRKSEGDAEKEIKLSRTQANRIKDEHKAINRAMAAKSMGNLDIHDVFFERAYDLGSVPQQEFREYVLAKLGV